MKYEEIKTIQLKGQYSILSELYNPKSKHKTHLQMGKMMDLLLEQLNLIAKHEQANKPKELKNPEGFCECNLHGLKLNGWNLLPKEKTKSGHSFVECCHCKKVEEILL